MTNNEMTIKSLFGNSAVHFEIPQYQRAYSWEKGQWKQFLEDLEDAETGYYLGHYLFECDGDRLLIIDGQQRLTTCVLFARAALDVLAGDEQYDKDVRVWRKRFLEDSDLGPRLETVPFDNPVFQDCIVSGRDAPTEFDTRSARNLMEAREYFVRHLSKLDRATVAALVRRMEDAVITTYDVADRAMAARIFAFQNDRGKALTKLETIKSHLMLIVYLRGRSDADKKLSVDAIDLQFSKIYETIMRGDMDEDEVLNNYWRARNGYFCEEVVEGVKKQLADAEHPLEWIRTFIRELAASFGFVEKFSADLGEYPVRLRQLNSLSLSYPFLLRAYYLCGLKPGVPSYESLLRLMENLTFRSLIRGGRADIQSRLDPHLKSIKDETSLRVEMEKIVNAIERGWWGYWSDAELARCLDSWFYRNRVDNYLLWQYELSLYGKGYKAPVAVTSQEMMKDESIEHIAPQTPTDGNELAHGYGEYDIKDSPENGIESGGWMNRIGNLMLASQSQNSYLGNNDFSFKLADYQKNVLQQQMKIADYAETMTDGERRWTVNSIKRRHADIVNWALKNWSIRSAMA